MTDRQRRFHALADARLPSPRPGRGGAGAPAAGQGMVCFVTLEDETGVANLVILPKVFDRYRKAIMTARLLVAEGRMQERRVTHLWPTN